MEDRLHDLQRSLPAVFSSLHNIYGNMMIKKRWAPLAFKDLFPTGKPINYTCSKKNSTKNQNNPQKTLGGFQKLKYVPQNSRALLQTVEM